MRFSFVNNEVANVEDQNSEEIDINGDRRQNEASIKNREI